jgi:hypothetical protein
MIINDLDISGFVVNPFHNLKKPAETLGQFYSLACLLAHLFAGVS